MTSISVDRNDNIWVLHVPQSVPEAQRANAAPPVLQFDAAGKLLTSWGGPGNGAEWLGREHGIFVDANDFVWLGGRAGWPRATTPGVSDDMIMKFTMAGELVMQIGRRGQSTGNLDTENVHQATDVFVDTQANEVYVADGYGNKRVFDSETGKFKRMWGAFGNPPPATFAPNVPTPQPQTTPDGPPELGLPHAIKVSHDGVVYLADRINNRIQMFTREGKYLKQVRVTNEGSDVVPVPAGFAFSPDRNQQFLYVVDSGPMRVVIFDRQSMTQIGVAGNRCCVPFTRAARCYTRVMKRALGNTGLAVEPIGLGGMPLSIQGRPDERTALAVIEAFVGGGGDHIDTASSYCLDEHDFGHNERLIAKALRKLGRTDIVVATKGGLTRPEGRWEVDCSPQWLRHCCEQSAATLGEPIRLYYLHAVDPAVPFAESLGELVRLRDEGKIAAIGLSNVTARHLDEAVRVTPIAAVQNRCNVLDARDFESGLVERCRELGIAYVAYSPVGGHFGHKRLDQYPSLARAAEKHSTTPYLIALAWLLAQGPHIVPIPGASKVSSIESSLTAPRVRLDAEDLAALAALGARKRTV